MRPRGKAGLLLLLVLGVVCGAGGQNSALNPAADPTVLSLDSYIASLDSLRERLESGGGGGMCLACASFPALSRGHQPPPQEGEPQCLVGLAV